MRVLFLVIHILVLLFSSCEETVKQARISQKEKPTLCEDTITQTNKGIEVDLRAFIPPDYMILDTAQGNLNQDSLIDMLLLLKHKTEDTAKAIIPERVLLILLGKPTGGFSLVARNDKTVYDKVSGGMLGDPYLGLMIKDGYFSIEHYGGSSWRWTRIITYKYDRKKRDWFLYKDGGESFHASMPETYTIKVKTRADFGKIRFSDFDIYKFE